jgi:hypothetical protein
MRKMLIPVLISGICILIACKGTSTPPPPLADNVFVITSIRAYAYSFGDYTAIVSWQNHDDVDAEVTGSIDYGDGGTLTVTGQPLQKSSSGTTWESYRRFHDYSVKGTYTVTFTLTAHFKRGDITTSFNAPFEIK